MGKSDNQLDFSRYDKALDLNRLMRQGMEAVVGELVYTREIYEKLNAIFEDSQDGFFITDGTVKVGF